MRTWSKQQPKAGVIFQCWICESCAARTLDSPHSLGRAGSCLRGLAVMPRFCCIFCSQENWYIENLWHASSSKSLKRMGIFISYSSVLVCFQLVGHTPYGIHSYLFHYSLPFIASPLLPYLLKRTVNLQIFFLKPSYFDLMPHKTIISFPSKLFSVICGLVLIRPTLRICQGQHQGLHFYAQFWNLAIKMPTDKSPASGSPSALHSKTSGATPSAWHFMETHHQLYFL